jgi:hypothetical protein
MLENQSKTSLRRLTTRSTAEPVVGLRRGSAEFTESMHREVIRCPHGGFQCFDLPSL